MPFPKKKKKSRFPVEGPLRRLPGQSVREERERLFDDKVIGYFLAVLVMWLLAGWQWLYEWTGARPNPQFATLLAAIVTLYCAYRIWRIRPELRNLNVGERGERRVSELLTQLRRKRYVAFDDLLVDQSNIDHVLVGPGGIFAIETKACSIFGNGCIGVDGSGVLRLSDKPAMRDPLGQASASAAKVAKILKERTRRDFDVTPVLIFPGWTLRGAKAETGVVVLNDGMISEFFESRPNVLSDDQITNICAHLDQAARI